MSAVVGWYNYNINVRSRATLYTVPELPKNSRPSTAPFCPVSIDSASARPNCHRSFQTAPSGFNVQRSLTVRLRFVVFSVINTNSHVRNLSFLTQNSTFISASSKAPQSSLPITFLMTVRDSEARVLQFSKHLILAAFQHSGWCPGSKQALQMRNTIYTVSEKNIPNIIDCQWKKCLPILIIFGTNIFDITAHQRTVLVPISPNVCFCTTWKNQNKQYVR